MLGAMQHRHIVALLGWCPEEHCLVYELAEKGNLEERGASATAGLGGPYAYRHRSLPWPRLSASTVRAPCRRSRHPTFSHPASALCVHPRAHPCAVLADAPSARAR